MRKFFFAMVQILSVIALFCAPIVKRLTGQVVRKSRPTPTASGP